MAKSDSSDYVGIRGSQQEVDSHRARSFVENARVRYEGVLESTELLSHDHYQCGELHSTRANGSSF